MNISSDLNSQLWPSQAMMAQPGSTNADTLTCSYKVQIEEVTVEKGSEECVPINLVGIQYTPYI